MSKRNGAMSWNVGGGTGRNPVKHRGGSLHVVGCVSTHKEKPEDIHLTAFLQAQKQSFEDEDAEVLEDDTQGLRAENQRRVEEMLQKAKEDLQKRKEKCSKEDKSKKKEATVPGNKADNQVILQKMEYLQNQNNPSEFGRSRTTGSTYNAADKESVQSLPLKKQDNAEYFSGTKQSKSKGKRKNRHSIVVSMVDLEKPLLEVAAEQKHLHSSQRCGSSPRQQQSAHPPLPPPAITCWQQKSGSELFPNVPTQALTVYGDESTEDEQLKLAIQESLKTHEAEKNRFFDFTEANCMDHVPVETDNSEGINQFPVPEPVQDESWDTPERMGQVESPCLLEENRLTAAGQVQDNWGNSTQHQDREMVAKQPHLYKQSEGRQMSRQKKGISKNNNKTNLITSKMDEVTEQFQTKGKNHIISDRSESFSNNQECNITSGDNGQPRSGRRINVDLNRCVKGEYEGGLWGPLEKGEACSRQQNRGWRGIKKHDQKRRQPLLHSHKSCREIKTHAYVPQDSGNRISQGQVDWNQEKSRNEEEKWDQEDCDKSNQNFIDSKIIYCSGEIWRAEKDNEWEGEKKQVDNWVNSEVQRHEPISQSAGIWRAEEASCFRQEERLTMPEKRMMGHFASKGSEMSGLCVSIDKDNEVQSDMGKCTDRTESSHDENYNSYSEVSVEQSFNFEPVSIPNSSEGVAQVLSATHIHDAHVHCTHNPHTSSQFHDAASSFLPSITSTAGTGHNTSSLPAMMGNNVQPHSRNIAHYVPNPAFQPLSQPLPAANMQELFDAFVRGQQQWMMNMNYMVQMAIMNHTGLPYHKLQEQQTNSLPMAALMSPLGGLPTNYNDFLLQSNALLNSSYAPVMNPSLLGMNQAVAPSNVPLHSEVLSQKGTGNTIQMPMPDSNINVNSAASTTLDASAFMLHHGNQKDSPLLTPTPFPIGHQNHQCSQTQQPSVGSMQNMMQDSAPDMCNQPFRAGPTSEGACSRMEIDKGRGIIM